jgi:hypothetical protein
LNLFLMKAVRIFIMLLTISTTPALSPASSRVRMLSLGNQMLTKTVFTRTRPLVSCLSSCPTNLRWSAHAEASPAVAAPTELESVCRTLEALAVLAWETSTTKTSNSNRSQVSTNTRGRWAPADNKTRTQATTSLTIRASRGRSARATRG